MPQDGVTACLAFLEGLNRPLGIQLDEAVDLRAAKCEPDACAAEIDEGYAYRCPRSSIVLKAEARAACAEAVTTRTFVHLKIYATYTGLVSGHHRLVHYSTERREYCILKQ
jgi:hypothetical protein